MAVNVEQLVLGQLDGRVGQVLGGPVAVLGVPESLCNHIIRCKSSYLTYRG